MSRLGHKQEDESLTDGAMAMFCPACPQPGINLPSDWKDRYTLFVFLAFIMCLILNLFKETNSSEHSSWMEISLQSTCNAELGRRMFPFLQVWDSWQTRSHTKPISRLGRNLSRCARISHLDITSLFTYLFD
jgi:hypothetical protein